MGFPLTVDHVAEEKIRSVVLGHEKNPGENQPLSSTDHCEEPVLPHCQQCQYRLTERRSKHVEEVLSSTRIGGRKESASIGFNDENIGQKPGCAKQHGLPNPVLSSREVEGDHDDERYGEELVE